MRICMKRVTSTYTAVTLMPDGDLCQRHSESAQEEKEPCRYIIPSWLAGELVDRRPLDELIKAMDKKYHFVHFTLPISKAPELLTKLSLGNRYL